MMRFAIVSVAVALSATSLHADVKAPAAVMYDEGMVSTSLTDVPGDVAAGRKAFLNRKQGNCLACHMNTDMEDQPFHGEVGPPLDGAGSRWEAAELRGIVSNAKMMFEDTIMPAFYKDTGYTRTLSNFDGKTILTAQQVEDIVAYLQTLKDEE